jgi:hypothetical protein
MPLYVKQKRYLKGDLVISCTMYDYTEDMDTEYRRITGIGPPALRVSLGAVEVSSRSGKAWVQDIWAISYHPNGTVYFGYYGDTDSESSISDIRGGVVGKLDLWDAYTARKYLRQVLSQVMRILL